MSVKRTHHRERERERECCLCEVILTIGIIRQTEQLYGESIHFLFVSYHILFVFLQTRQNTCTNSQSTFRTIKCVSAMS